MLSLPGVGDVRWVGGKDLEKGALPIPAVNQANANSSSCILYVQPSPIKTVPYQQLLSWGLGSHGRLGLGDTHHVRVPYTVNTVDRASFVRVAAGHNHSVALTGACPRSVAVPTPPRPHDTGCCCCCCRRRDVRV